MIGQTISHYRIVEKIGEGGMGEVYLRRGHLALPRQVALKFLPETLQQDAIARKRFLREARSAAALDHPYICNVFEVAQTDDGQDFIVMEYVEGETLQDRLAEGPLPLRETLKLGSELAEAIWRPPTEGDHPPGPEARQHHAHARRVTPRSWTSAWPSGDSRKDGREQDISSALTREGSTLGTLSYMSPEQIRGEQVDHRSDIFSFGIVLYEMRDRSPSLPQDPDRRDRRVPFCKEDPPPATRYLDDVPELLVHTLEKMLEKDPAERISRFTRC